jgi:hypothetical protein
MKILFLAFVFMLLSIHAKAQTLQGVVKHFKGHSVETHQNYSYYALETAESERFVLPQWIDARVLSEISGHELLMEGSIEYKPCTDMSEACPTGEIKKMRWLQFQNPMLDSVGQVYTGNIKRFKGRAVESSRLYDYIAISAGSNRIELPLFLKAKELLVLNPQVTLMGELFDTACTEMSEACGPTKLHSMTLLKLQF